MRSPLPLVSLMLLSALFAGCASDADPKSDETKDGQAEWSEDQKKALKDPMNYRPEMDRTDVSGGGTRDFDRKGFKEDMKAWTLD